MEKELRQHLTYGLVLLIVIAGIVLYQNKITVETRQELSQQIAQLSEELADAKSELAGDINALQEKNSALEGNVTTLGESLAEKESAILGLTGDLEQLRTQSEEQAAELEQTVNQLQVQYEDFSGVIEDIVPSVVSIKTNTGSGSGFIVDNEGYIVTNYHVIKGATAADVLTSDGNVHGVRLVGYSSIADIAVLKIEGSFDALLFGDSDDVKVGEKVIAVGNPAGLDFTVTQGIVSAVDRTDSKGNEFIQIDVPINPGNSGGPLVDASGRIVGVNTLKISGFEGLGFALAGSQVDIIAGEIINKDKVAGS